MSKEVVVITGCLAKRVERVEKRALEEKESHWFSVPDTQKEMLDTVTFATLKYEYD